MILSSTADFLKISFFKQTKKLRNTFSVKHFGPRSGPTFRSKQYKNDFSKERVKKHRFILTVCKVYQQTTKDAAVNKFLFKQHLKGINLTFLTMDTNSYACINTMYKNPQKNDISSFSHQS